MVDTYNGLYSVDTATGEQKLVWSTNTKVPGAEQCKLLNNFDVLSNGSIFLSCSSTRYPIHEFTLDILDGRPTGKLMVFHPEQDETRVLIDGIAFANGVLLSKDESFVLVAETSRLKILRYYRRGRGEERRRIKKVHCMHSSYLVGIKLTLIYNLNSVSVIKQLLLYLTICHVHFS